MTPDNGANGKWWTKESDTIRSGPKDKFTRKKASEYAPKNLREKMGPVSTDVLNNCTALCQAQSLVGVCAFKDGWGGVCMFSPSGALQDYKTRYGRADKWHYAARCTSDKPKICPMDNLAPKYLVDRAYTFDDARLSESEKQAYNGYSTLSFEGGGSGMDYRYGMDGGVGTDVTYGDKDYTHDTSKTFQFGGAMELRSPFIGFGGSYEGMHGWTENEVEVRSKVVSTTDDAYASFHLEGASSHAQCCVSNPKLSPTS